MIKKIDCPCGKQHRENTQTLINHNKQFDLNSTSGNDFNVTLKIGINISKATGTTIADAIAKLNPSITNSGFIFVEKDNKKIEKLISFINLRRMFSASPYISKIRQGEFAKILESAFI